MVVHLVQAVGIHAAASNINIARVPRVLRFQIW